MPQNRFLAYLPHWRSLGALLFFSCALLGFQSGVWVSERPGLAESGLLIQAYYSLSLFVMGGVDLGVPSGGAPAGRVLVWLAYFGAPVLFASTVINALIRGFASSHWQLRRIRNHVLVVGADELILSYLRVLRQRGCDAPIVAAGRNFELAVQDELREDFGATVVIGDVTHEYYLRQLRPQHASKVLLLGANSLRSYEAASVMLGMFPDIGPKLVVHCASLRFMRAMRNTEVAQQCQVFNTYHLAASGLVRNHLLSHFRSTSPKDTVVLAGFGLFGQTILEELLDSAADEIKNVIIIDKDARRRVLVADEQRPFSGPCRREVFQGDIANPGVWQQLQERIDLNQRDSVVVLGTGGEEDNLRTALWIRERFPLAKVIARSSKGSRFATEVAEGHDIVNVSISDLLEENIPGDWVEFS